LELKFLRDNQAMTFVT